MHCYVILSNVFDWNCVEIVSTYKKLLLVVSFKVCLYQLLYHYTINNDYMWYNVCSAWFLDIRISACFFTYYSQNYPLDMK